MTNTGNLCLAAALVMQVGIAVPVQAQTAVLPDTQPAPPIEMQAEDTVSYMVIRQPLVQFLAQVERDTGHQIETTASVNGMITDMRLQGDLAQVLSQLSQRFELQWFAFNGVHYVSAQSESRMRLVRLGDVPSSVAKAVLAESGLMSDRFPVADAAQGTAIALTGPPKLLGLSEAVIEAVVVEPQVVLDNRIVVRRGGTVSIEPHSLAGLAESIAAREAAASAAAPPVPPTTEEDS